MLRPHIDNNASLCILLQRHLSTLFLRLKNETRNVDIQRLLIEVAGNFDFDLVVNSITLVLFPAVPGGVNGILYGQEYTFDGIICYVSIDDETLLIVFLLWEVSFAFHIVYFEI